MREIKFKGKRLDNREWVYGNLIVDEGRYYICLQVNEHIKRDDYEVYMIEVISETVRQYTELHDKNEKEIYEGDILRFSDVDTAVVEWNSKYSSFIVKPIQDYYFDSEILGNAIEYSKVEVIGNIYKNADLLKD